MCDPECVTQLSKVRRHVVFVAVVSVVLLA